MEQATIKLVLLAAVLSLTNSCSYCFLEQSIPHHRPRDLSGGNSTKIDLCCLNLGSDNSKGFQTNFYYGNISPESANSNVENKIMPMGEVGFRIEKYIAPGKFFPVNILGLGLDYAYGNNYNILQHRLLLSTNLIFLVRRKTVGYISVQGGIRYNEIEKENKTITTNELAYRNAIGLQYYFISKTAMVIETGYGNGAIVRIGIDKWF
jgi:hypothetical protein